MKRARKPTLLLAYVNLHAGEGIHHDLPLGLQFVAAVARQCGWRVVGRFWGAGTTAAACERELARIKPELLGLYVDMLNSYAVARLLRRIAAEVRPTTILGGPEATFNPRRLAAMTSAEIVARGPGEPIIRELLQGDWSDPRFLRTVRGISFRAGGRIRHNPDRKPEPEVDLLPDRSLLAHDREVLYLVTARGCPNRCAFCSEAAVPYRPRRTETVRRELAQAMKRGRPRWIQIVDDTFTADVPRARELAAELKKIYGGPWSCEVNAADICRHPELAEELAAAGLTRVQLGIESMNEATLRLYQKRTTREKTEQAIALLLEGGVQCVFGNFIVGAPGESAEMVRANIEAARELLRRYPGRIELSASILSYNPGAPFFEEPQRFGLTLSQETLLGAMDLRSAACATATLSRQQILELHEEFCAALSAEVDRQLQAVPRAVVRAHLTFADLGIHSIWGRKLLAKRHIAKYYQLVNFDQSHRDLDELAEAQMAEAIPQRTRWEIQHSLAGQVILGGLSEKLRELNATASFLYEMACGQHTIAQIADHLQQRLPGHDRTPRRVILADTIGFYRQLAEELQIVFVVP